MDGASLYLRKLRLLQYKSDSQKMAGTLDGQKILVNHFRQKKLISIIEIAFP